MRQAKVTMNVRKVSHQASIIDIQGEITSFAENALMEAYNQASDEGATTIILNFSHLEYMNSGGLGLLVMLLVRVKRQNQRLLAFGLNKHYQDIFEIIRLNETIGIFDLEADALAAVSD
jgi:anti-anti-sigma factor